MVKGLSRDEGLNYFNYGGKPLPFLEGALFCWWRQFSLYPSLASNFIPVPQLSSRLWLCTMVPSLGRLKEMSVTSGNGGRETSLDTVAQEQAVSFWRVGY